jgi:quinol monooxygenase YgiN
MPRLTSVLFFCLLLLFSCSDRTGKGESDDSVAVEMSGLEDVSQTQNKNQLVRLAVIEVDSAQLVSYNNFLKEEIQASIRIEPGVLTLYAVAEKLRPTYVTIFETYADSSQYRAHLSTPHFQKYKTGTLNMVRHLQLIETVPIIYEHKPGVLPENEDPFVRMIQLEVDFRYLENYKEIVSKVMKPGIKNESGLLTMYGVAEKSKPTHITVLEIYADAAAYQAHIQTPHFIKYKTDTRQMVKSMEIFEVVPIWLGGKDVTKK